MQRVILSLAIHNHQPVGNFPHVFETAYVQSYLPMVEALEHHPSIRVALHYSGPLLDWLEGSHPEFFPRLRALVARGQVELMTGGYYEPILAIIPDRDKRGQIRKMTAYLRRRFGAHARGLWLAERVWEPHLAQPIAEAGVEYTVVDDAHFIAAGLRDEELTGYFVTEEEGVPLKVFPSRRQLRYLIPWQSPADVLAYLRPYQGRRSFDRAQGRPAVLLMGDDGEKFGLWPGTYTLCWERGWVDAFFRAVEAEASWLTVMAPSEAANSPAAGRVYLPTASYDEMTEWALPADRGAEFAQIRRRSETSGDRTVEYLRGGYWRQFLVKYPEINTMHKKMLRVSKKVWAMPPGRRRQHALDELWRAQCNCPYWHGVFGGIYLPHIRRANFTHLITADALADGAKGSTRPITEDLDGDGADEVEVASQAMVLTIDPADGGSVVEWDWRPQRINLTNVLTRRPEAYHRQLQEASTKAAAPDGAVETIHTTRVRVKEPGLERLLTYDWYRRASFLDHILGPDVTQEAFSRSRYAERGDFVNQPYTATLSRGHGQITVTLVRDGGIRLDDDRLPLHVEKRFTIDGRAPRLIAAYRVVDVGERPVNLLFGVETNWAITDPEAPLDLDGQRHPARTLRAAEHVERIQLHDRGWDGTVSVAVPPATVWLHPLETVSNSEGGFERIFQGVTCVCTWPIALRPQEVWQAVLTFTLQSPRRLLRMDSRTARRPERARPI